jgi:uncharacterized protein
VVVDQAGANPGADYVSGGRVDSVVSLAVYRRLAGLTRTCAIPGVLPQPVNPGCVSITIFPMTLSPAQQAFLLDLARSAIVNALRRVPDRPPAVADPLMNQPCGCFVTLHDAASHRLRGCIGRIQSADPLVFNVHQSALGAMEDPRFRSNPVTLAELPRLDLEISVLSPLMPAAHVLDFEPSEHGIFLTHQGRTGTFLPQVARETGWGREELLTHLCGEKMGIGPEAWKEPAAKLFKYTATIIGPVLFGQPAGGQSTFGGFAGGNRFTM